LVLKIENMKENPLFKPYQANRAYQHIAREITQAILLKRLSAGDRLPSERSLADQFQVGRLTVREALRALETKGLIKIRHGRGGGAYVGFADPHTLPSAIMDNLQLEGITHAQMIEARIGLECAIVQYAIVHATGEDLEHIERNIEESKEVIRLENTKLAVSKMIDYHVLVGEATHNLPFIMFIRALMEWARRKLAYWFPTPEEQLYSYKAHRKILQSIKRKEVNLAQTQMKKHVIRVGEYIEKSCKAL